MKKLDKDILVRKKKLEKEIVPIDNAIYKRLDYIFKTVFKAFDSSFSSWWVDGAPEGCIGDFCSLVHDDEIEVCPVEFGGSTKKNKTYFEILLNDHEWDLESEIPIHWLWEDFETELMQGKEDYIQSKMNTKEKKQALINSAKSKLSVEESRALGL